MVYLDPVKIEFNMWRDRFGMISTYEDRRSTDNGLRFTAQEMICLSRLRLLDSSDIQRFCKLVRSCYVPGRDGLLNRRPEPTGLNQMDDYTAVLAACSEIGAEATLVAREILSYGEHWRYGFTFFYNNERPGSFFQKGSYKPAFAAWLGRMPAFVAHAYLSNHEVPPIFYRTLWTRIMERSGTKGDQDSFAIPWLMAVSHQNSGWKNADAMCAIIEFRKNFLEAYPRGMNQLMADYTGIPDHPLCKYQPFDLWNVGFHGRT